MEDHARASWMASLEHESCIDCANAALAQLRDSLHAADEALAKAEAALRQAGSAQSMVEHFLGHDLNFEAASTRMFLRQQLAIMRVKILDGVAAVAQNARRCEAN